MITGAKLVQCPEKSCHCEKYIIMSPIYVSIKLVPKPRNDTSVAMLFRDWWVQSCMIVGL